MTDPFAEERKAIAAVLQDLRDIVLAVRKMTSQRVKPALDPESYALEEIGENALAYRYVGTGEPMHHICTGCYAKGEKSVLQGRTSEQNNTQGKLRDCARCKSIFASDKID